MASAVDARMDALVLDPSTRTVALEKVPRPSPGPLEILVRVEAISLNPIDPLYTQFPLANSKRTVGSDFAGTIESIGDGTPNEHALRIGDRISGFLQGACSVNERPGAFAEYLVVPYDLVWKIPDGMSTEEAAGVSLVALTAAQSIWYRLGLQAPFEHGDENAPTQKPKAAPVESINVFIYGASTSVGLFAAQMVRISAVASGQKIRLFGAASSTRWNMLQSEPYCYERLVDYREHDWSEQVSQLIGGANIQYAYDCISEGTSVKKVSSLLAKSGKMAIVRSREGGAWKADNLINKPIYGAVWEGLGEEVQYQGFTVPRSPKARHFSVEFYRWLSSAAGSEIEPVPIRLMPGGMAEVVTEGFLLLGSARMEDRKIASTKEWMKPISAEKLVYKI